MAKRRRRMFSAAESAEVWDRWQRGEGLALIGRMFDRSSGAIFQHLKPHGGIRPPVRRRSRRVLSLDEREEISRGIAAGVSLRSIAADLHRAPSTISRELRRNGGHRRYRAAAADSRAWDRALRPSGKLTLADHAMRFRYLVRSAVRIDRTIKRVIGPHSLCANCPRARVPSGWLRAKLAPWGWKACADAAGPHGRWSGSSSDAATAPGYDRQDKSLPRHRA